MRYLTPIAFPLMWAGDGGPNQPVTADGDGWSTKVWSEGATSILLVSESPSWCGDVAGLLDAEGYAVRIAARGDAGLAPEAPFDLAMVDVLSSGESPAAVFAALRTLHSIPIIAVVPPGLREPSILEVYSAGADQLVLRDVGPHELLARVRALLRRSPPSPRGPVTPHDVGSIQLDRVSGTATVGGTRIELSVREAEILYALLERPGRVVTRDQLAGLGRGRRDAQLLDSNVRSVRSKLEAAEGIRRIVVVRGVGFRLMPDEELYDLSSSP